MFPFGARAVDLREQTFRADGGPTGTRRHRRRGRRKHAFLRAWSPSPVRDVVVLSISTSCQSVVTLERDEAL